MSRALGEALFERYIPVPESGCWLYDGRLTDHGYGIAPRGVSGRSEGAHRAFYRRFKGEIPPGMCVCHKCDTPPCVNPDHLFLGTNEDNAADRSAKGRARGEWNGRTLITEREAMRALWAVNVPAGVMARELGVARSTIASIRNGSTWTHLPRPPGPNPLNVIRGERHRCAKLTAEQVMAIRHRRANGERTADLAAEFGISAAHARRLAAGEQWPQLGRNRN